MRKKSVSIRIGSRFEAECCNLVTGEGQVKKVLKTNGLRTFDILSFTLFQRLVLNVPSIGLPTPSLGKFVS